MEFHRPAAERISLLGATNYFREQNERDHFAQRCFIDLIQILVQAHADIVCRSLSARIFRDWPLALCNTKVNVPGQTTFPAL